MFNKLSARAIITSLLAFSSFFIFAQQQITSIPLKGDSFGSVQCAFAGDTTFLAFAERINGTICYRMRLIFKDGSYKVVQNSRLIDKAFIGIDNANDSLYIYFIEEKRKTISITYVVNRDSTETSRVAHKLSKGELFLGTFKHPGQRGFNIVTAPPIGRQLTVLHVHGASVVQSSQINLPMAFFEKKPSSFAFIPEGHVPSPKEADARTKVYWNTNQVIITEDVAPNYMTKTAGKTTMVSIDLTTGKQQSRLILEPNEIDFSTYVHNNVLYKIQKDPKELTVEVYDSINKKVHSFQINKKSTWTNEQAYERNERFLRVSGDKTVRNTLSRSGNGFISVHPIDAGKVIFKVGVHKPLEDPKTIPMNVAFGVLGTAVLNSIANAANYQMLYTEYIDSYFYLNEEFDYIKAANFVQQRIDDFEKGSEKDEFIFKSYGQNPKEVIGIYVWNNSSELKLVRFAK